MGNSLETESHTTSNVNLTINKSIQIDYSGSLAFDDCTDSIYLLDHTTHEVSVINTRRQQIIVRARPDHFPWSIKCVNSWLYVTDTFQHCVNVFDNTGTLLFTRFSQDVNNPREIEVAGNLLYLCDNGHSRLLVLTLELYIVSIIRVDFPTDVILLLDEVMVYSSERHAVTVLSEGNIRPEHYSIDSRVKGYEQMHRCRRTMDGNLIMFNPNSAQLLYIDEITFKLARIMGYKGVMCLNYMEMHPDQNRLAILYKKEKAETRDSVHLTYIQLSA